VPFARELVTLDDVSQGRLTLGIGAGGTGFDATILGQLQWSRRERVERFVEFVALLDRLLREPATSYEGKFYSASEARTYPGCVQRPRIPFAIAATGARGLRLAATYGETWVTTGDPTSGQRLGAKDGAGVVRQQMDRLDEACVKLGRDPASLGRLVLAGPQIDPGLSSAEAFRDTTGSFAAAGVTDFVVHWPRRDEPYAGDAKTFEHVVSCCLPPRRTD
jgi:alkanesulfonate monooxygenase SsuD/methylene tetrahydromethanopterin reductase-like flavin-dependent oxidoreductase (luciferase family)